MLQLAAWSGSEVIHTYDVDLLCDKFAKYEMRQKLQAAKSGKGEGSTSCYPVSSQQIRRGI